MPCAVASNEDDMRRVLQSQERTILCNRHHLVTMTTNSVSQASSRPCSSSDLEEALHVLEGRWKILILYHLFSAPVMRLSELQRVMSSASPKMLVQQLRDLERRGVVHRKVYPEVPPKVEYALTESGNALLPVLQALQVWAIDRQQT
jgi:DNA-binding HxlR family transcriptional regulator